MEVQKINLTHLNNNDYFQYHSDFCTFVNIHDAEKLKIAALYASYVATYNALDAAFKKIKKSKHTADVRKADKFRDEVWTGMTDILKAGLNHYNSEVRKAAETVKIVFNTYGKIDKLPYNEETAAIHNIVQDFQGKYSNEVAIVGLTQWVIELQKANETFKNLMLERYDETAAQPNLVMRTIRLKLDEEYNAITKHIDAAIVIEGEDNYREFVTAFNVVIKRYADVLAQRKGRAAAKKVKKEE